MKLSGFGFLVGTLGPWDSGNKVGQTFGFQVVSQRTSRRSRQKRLGTFRTSLHQQASDFDDDEDEEYSRLASLSSGSLTSSFRTALCIIPPDWDTLQRARHFAQDQTYHQWPPAIRLFHPFCPRSKLSNVALDLAKIVEKHNIQPFKITLNQWTVMPLPNNLQTMLEDQSEVEINKEDDDSPMLEITPEEEAVHELIADEARKGRERKKQRELRRLLKTNMERIEQDLEVEEEGANSTTCTTTQSATTTETETFISTLATTTTPPETEQNEEDDDDDSPLHDEFNGPAMIALEPDARSIRKLKQLRELLRQELQEEYDPSAPSPLWDSAIPLYDEHDEEEFEEFVDEITAFRPLIPVGAFPTIDAALATAKKLKGLWDPLTFQVTDLHFISQPPSSRQRMDVETELYRNRVQNAPNSSTPKAKRNVKDSEVPFGRDALVMLMGEEIEQDKESNELLANMVCKEGTPGGYGRQDSDVSDEMEEWDDDIDDDDDDAAAKDEQYHLRLFEDFERKLDAKGGDFEGILEWLDDEDDEELEIGTTVVIGRTHIFSGETRSYDGMPASSIVEEADGTFGMGSGSLGSDPLLWNDVDIELRQTPKS